MDRNPPGSFGYGIFPDQGPNPSPLFCEHGLLASGSPGWSPKVFLAWALYDKVTPTFASIYTWPSSLCVSLCPNFPGLMRTWVTGLKPVLKGSSELDYTCTDYIGIPCFTVLLRIMLCKHCLFFFFFNNWRQLFCGHSEDGSHFSAIKYLTQKCIFFQS